MFAGTAPAAAASGEALVEKVSYIGEFLGQMRYSAQRRRQVSRGGATFRKGDRILVDETRPQQNRQLDTGGDIH